MSLSIITWFNRLCVDSNEYSIISAFDVWIKGGQRDTLRGELLGLDEAQPIKGSTIPLRLDLYSCLAAIIVFSDSRSCVLTYMEHVKEGRDLFNSSKS